MVNECYIGINSIGSPVCLTDFFGNRCPWTAALEHLIHEQHRNRTPKPAIHEQHRALVVCLPKNPQIAIHQQHKIKSHCPYTCILLGQDGNDTLLVFSFIPIPEQHKTLSGSCCSCESFSVQKTLFISSTQDILMFQIQLQVNANANDHSITIIPLHS